MTIENWRAAGAFFNYKGHRIFSREEEGAGPILLLLHGFPTASWDWQKIWLPLAEKFHLLAPDMIGFGFSDKPKNYRYSILDQADLHEHLLEERSILSVHILAHDYGNTVAQELLARFLDRKRNHVEGLDIQSVCFLNGGLFYETLRPRFIQKVLLSPIGKWMSPFMGKESLRRNFHAIFGKNTPPTEAEIDAFWQLIEHNNGKAIFHKLIHFLTERRLFRDRWVDALQQAEIPIRLINGPEDPISGRHLATRYRQLIPNADVILLEGIGHYPQVESPKQVLEHFLCFYENNFEK